MGGSTPDQAPDKGVPPLLEAALGYVARGWPVFPCNPKNKQPLLAAKKDSEGKKIQGTGGVSAASTDPDQIRAWWKRWPRALIGLATGHPTIDAGGLRMFVVDFDPRTDETTGEVWDLASLKADFEELIGCKLPESTAVLTPSDGVHLYLLQGDDGEPIKNSASKFTEHVDVRGLGGYVIAAPGQMAEDAIKGQGGLRYRVHRKEPLGGMAKAPAGLLELLRRPKGKATAERAPPAERQPTAPVSSNRSAQTSTDDAVRKYALAALDGECREIRGAPSGRRNAQLNTSALKVASLVAAGALEATLARHCVEAAARDNPGNDDDGQLIATIDSGWSAGLNNPRDLGEIAAAAAQRASRRRDDRARNPSGPRSPAAPAAAAGRPSEPFRDGKGRGDPQPEPAREPTAAERVQLGRIAEAWLERRLDQPDLTAKQLGQIAWGAGRRVAANLLEEGKVKEQLWAAVDECPDATLEEVDRSLADGFNRGFDVWPTLQDLELARLPMTDFGLAERFLARFGRDFRFTTAQGWLGWDGQRWKVLDQDKDTAPAELIAAVFETIRSVQREARRIRETGVKWKLTWTSDKKRQVLADDDDPTAHALDYYHLVGRQWKRFSEQLAGWGRQCELAGKPSAIASLARGTPGLEASRYMTVPIEHFDAEQMAINCRNGTLRFEIEHLPDGSKKAIPRRYDHRREDLITRLAPVDWDPSAEAPLYDAMIAWAQPDPGIRRYLHQVGGYSCSGDTGEHKLWFNYGRGRNGKSVTSDSWCSALGDYSGTIGIESFLDQGIKKRGDAATPDLARLGGVRLLRASEPERGAKLNSALIKMATGGEPMAVRALHRGFFDLTPRFKLWMSGNSKPQIPDTDEGIWGRMKLIPWLRHIEKPEEDPYREEFPVAEGQWPEKDQQLTNKIKAGELDGVFRRLVDGLVDYLEHGFVEPRGVTIATADYRNQSDPLARFLSLCTVRERDQRVKSSELHEVFAAWCKAAGEKEWTQKGFSDAMIDKGYTKTRSDGMRWEHLKLIKFVSDFVDGDGRVLRNLAEPDDGPPAAGGGGIDFSTLPPAPGSSPATRAAFPDDDDDLPMGL